MSDTKQDFAAAGGASGNTPKTTATSQDNGHDAWGRDTSQWIEVGGKLKPHP